MKRLLWWLLAPLLVLIGLASGAWLWLGSDASLATALQHTARFLPAGHTLEAQDVSGSLRRGGYIGSLRYHSPSLALEAQDVAVGWQLRPLLQRELRLGQLHIATLRIEQTPSTEPTPPLTEFVLPFTLHVPFDIAALDWVGPPALHASHLTGNYSFDSTLHKLDLRKVHISSGTYSAQASLQARSPMALQATLQGALDTTLPGTSQPLHVQASASATGPLAGPDALLHITAALAPGNPLQATLSAQIKPWADQPIHQADALFQQLNLADLWPQAPHTLLGGSLQITPDGPDGTGWRAQARVDNRLSGPWDTSRIPLEQLQTRLQYRQGSWRVDTLNAHIGNGELQASGQQAGNDWSVQARLQRINPVALHSQLDPALLDGTVNAHVSARSSGPAIQFDAALQPAANAPANAALRGLRIRSVQAVGRWAAGVLSLSQLKLQTDDALLQGPVDFNTTSKAAKGQLQLTLPGAQADLQGQISATQGAGDVKLSIRDADLVTRWLARLPGAAASLHSTAVKGQADLAGHWSGGWASTAALSLQAQLAVPTLEVRAATGAPTTLRQFQLNLSGGLQALDIRLQGELANGTRRVQLNSQASAHMATPSQWQARIASLALQLQDSNSPGTWKLQLDQALALQLAHTAKGSSVDAAAGSASLSGPVPGTARIAWQPVAWAHDGDRSRLSSSGTLQGLPMGWLDAISASAGQLAQLGLKGDLLLDGDWNLQAAQTLQVSANLARRSGDLQLLTGDEAVGSKAAPSTISAGIRTARIGLRSDGNSLSASLRWDSERAGQAEADFSTAIRQTADGWNNWQWPADAPVSGSIHAALPRVGIWSVLAPPGWRMRGTLAADARLGGSRAAPLWSGTLQADDLALRSVVEGIELRDGRLRAQLDGQRLNITEFSLHGAPTAADAKTGVVGNDGGSLNASGTAQWTTSTTAPAGIQLDLKAQASGLRISARADRRLAVSGTLQAQLAQGKLVLQGALKADQALFVLPEETAPSLGGDVRVRSKTTTAVAPAAPVAARSPALTPQITLALDLGDDFHLIGRGIDTRLAGQLTLRAGPTLAGPRLTGELRTVRGSYRAYGQNLDIDEGVLRFNGPFDNPALDILAIRPNLSVRVGVQITGTALSPSIRLVSESDLSDAEKLAWLVLGRSAANGGAEAAVLQQAALALLGGNGKGISGGLASALGLDELSFSGSASNTDGSTNAAAVTFGKRLSRDFYVSYEHSLAGTLGTLYIFYDLSKRFTLRAQTGEQSAIDLIFTLQYD